jgi:amidohydrolase
MTAPIADAARELQPWIVERRRHLHRNPELSFHEAKTAAFVAGELRALGLEPRATGIGGNHGLCAEIHPAGGPTAEAIALRADMDALPIQELSGLPFQSQVPGVSHMCGHDAHTTMLLGATRLLNERRGELPRTVRLFYQAAEEKFPGGARDIVAAGLLEGVRMVFGLHVDPRHDTGTLHLIEGNAMAGVDEFTLHVRGKGGHAAMPHLACDPVLAAAHVITSLQQIVSRRLDPFEPGVVSVTQVSGGTAFNVIPGEVTLNGTVRSFRPDMHDFFRGEIARIAESVAAAHGCSTELIQHEGHPPLCNAPEAVARMERAGGAVLGAAGVKAGTPMMGSEDFALYSRERPACFGFLGVGAPDDTERFMVHHPKFVLDEDALWRGAAVLAAVALEG